MLQFLVKKGAVATPCSDYCLPGITRATVRFIIFCSKNLLVSLMGLHKFVQYKDICYSLTLIHIPNFLPYFIV